MWLVVGALAAAALPARAQIAAQDDVYSTQAGVPLSVGAPNGVLANDTGQGLQASLVANVSNGILLLNAAGGFFYLPSAGFSGNDSFTYQAVQGSLTSNVATVTISVIPAGGGNVPPVARPDSYTLSEDETLTVSAANGVLANDTDANGNPLTAVLVAGVANGTLALNPDGSFTYTPPPNMSGSASFSYQADDGMARSATVTVSLTITAVNDAPIAEADRYTTAEDTPLTVTAANGVLANDSDAEGEALTAVLAAGVATGTLALNPDGSFTYTPPANFSGLTTFTYRARDASLAESAPATVTIDVTAVNDPPFISSAPPTTATEGVTYRYTLTAVDPDGTTPTISAPTLPGWLTFQAPATISGTPDDADVGTHEVLMSVTDGIAPPVVQRFEVTVSAVDDAPSIATIPEQTATENTPFELDLARFVTDDDTPAASLEYAATDALPDGLSLSPAGLVSGTPAIATSVGTRTVRFTVADDTTTVPGQLVLTVLPAGRVDLAVTMSASPNPVPLDTPTAWTITVTNRAQQVGAQGATLEASFGGEVPFDLDAPPASSGCTLTPAGDRAKLECSLGPLAGGASATIALTGRGSVAGDVFATASVAVAGGGALDETASNDTTTAALGIAQRVTGLPAQRIDLADARAAEMGDFNGDGYADLVVAAAQGVVLFTNVADPANPGRRAFATPPQALGAQALATDVAVADLDLDGDLDVVTAAGNGAPGRVFVNTAGVFASVPLGDAAVDSRAVAVGDVNGDSFPDVVLAASGTSPVLMNSGAGAVFTAGPGVGPHDARDVLLVDLFGDALPELVVADGAGGAAVYRNTAGAFVLETTLATGPTSAVAAGDFNGDGRADLVFARDTVAPPGVPSALVLLNTSVANGQFFAADELGAAPTAALAVRDFNLDSRADVLALNGYGVRLFTDAGAANGTFALHPLAVATPGARAAAVGDLNNDNRVDVAVVGNGVAVFFNDGAGNFGEPDSSPPVIQLRGAATVDVTIDSPYVDAGATAADAEDGDITSRIVVVSTVDTTVLGTYTVTYSVSDLSGNPAVPVVRTVNVLPQPAASEGGGGALGIAALALLVAALALRRRSAA